MNKLTPILFVAALLPCVSQSQTLLFKSGFEPGTILGPVTGTAPNGPEQSISGTDPSTGFTWPIAAFSPNPGLDGIHIIPPHTSTDANSNHFFNSLNSSTFHSGSQALQLEMTGYPDQSCCAQDVLNMVGMSQPITSLYQRVWIKLGPEVATQIAAHPSDFWRTIFAIKTQTDYRIEAYVYKDNSSSNAYFYAHADNGAQSSPTQTYWQSSCKASSGCNVPVPLNQWFLMEVYLKRSGSSDGQFFMAINGQTIVNHLGPNYGASSQPIYQWMITDTYGEYFPMQEWVDDLELWSAPPCATLPCGAGTGSSSGGTSYTAPSITTNSLPAGTVGSAYATAISASGTTPLTWSIAAGSLPSGLSLNSSNGAISGTPSTAGTSTSTVQATNAAGTDSQQLSITVNPQTTTATWYNLVSVNSGKCLDVPGSSTSENVQLDQSSCTGEDNQKFSLGAVSGGYKITNKHSGYQLNVRGWSTSDGGAVIQWPFDGSSANAIWNMHPLTDGSDTFTVNSSGKCLDVTDASKRDGALVDQYSCDGAANQKWNMVPVQ